jgi:hypothetical protein
MKIVGVMGTQAMVDTTWRTRENYGDLDTCWGWRSARCSKVWGWPFRNKTHSPGECPDVQVGEISMGHVNNELSALRCGFLFSRSDFEAVQSSPLVTVRVFFLKSLVRMEDANARAHNCSNSQLGICFRHFGKELVFRFRSGWVTLKQRPMLQHEGKRARKQLCVDFVEILEEILVWSDFANFFIIDRSLWQYH